MPQKYINFFINPMFYYENFIKIFILEDGYTLFVL